MYETFTRADKLRLFFKLFIPMIITQFALIGGNFVAVFLTGQYGTDDLAGMSVGFNVWITIYTALLGVLYGITPLISNALGANAKEELHALIQNGFYMATAFGLVALVLGLIFVNPFIHMLHLAPHATYVAQHYMIAIGLCTVPLLWVCMMRNVCDSHGFTHYSMAIIVMGFTINSILNYLLIFGKFGFPELGGVGAGYATAISVWCNVLAYTYVLHKRSAFKDYQLFSKWSRLDFQYWKAQLAIGVPIGIAIFAEMSIFSVAAFAMAFYGTDFIAAQQAALSFTSLLYCVPLTISLTATIVVAFELGAKRYRDAIEYSNITRLSAIFFAVFIATGGFTHIESIAALYTNNENMVSLIAHFLSYALFFSIIDAFGTPVQGILRGYQDVRIVTVIAISCYWGVGFPTAAIFSMLLGFGPYGIWVGMLSGIAAGGICYIWRLRYQQKKLRALAPEQFAA